MCDERRTHPLPQAPFQKTGHAGFLPAMGWLAQPIPVQAGAWGCWRALDAPRTCLGQKQDPELGRELRGLEADGSPPSQPGKPGLQLAHRLVTRGVEKLELVSSNRINNGDVPSDTAIALWLDGMKEFLLTQHS